MTDPVAQQDQAPFWQRKTLAEMSHDEWESLCDGCGRCCVLKFEDLASGEIYPTAIACRLLDLETCRCTRYAERQRLVPECIRLDADSLGRYSFLPESCAYRRLDEGRSLAWWHPLVSGDPGTVAEAGIGVGGQLISEQGVHPDEPLQEHVLRWVDEPDDE